VQGHDAPAHEVQDGCAGHPNPGGTYHYHSISPCIPHINDRNALVGYALDGFGIFGPYAEDGNEFTSADLDECHGITSLIPWNGKTVMMYHYVLTRDYPYTIGCFRGTPAQIELPPPSQPPGPRDGSPSNQYPVDGVLEAVSCGSASGAVIDLDAASRPVTVFFTMDGPYMAKDSSPEGNYVGAVTAIDTTVSGFAYQVVRKFSFSIPAGPSD